MQQEDGKRGALMELITTIPSFAEAATASASEREQAHDALAKNLETLLTAVRPRLLSLAYMQGISPEAAEDVVQETLVAAWRQLATLRDPARFDAWLAGICRNLCRMQARSTCTRLAHQTAPGMADRREADATPAPSRDLPDPLGIDPIDALERQDLETLLDRAMSYLPEHTREALELCYLHELPQREAALRLGMTVGALEVRLHRARRQMRQILSGPLRAEAEAFGLPLDEALPAGWHATREWCHQCGRRYLLGSFEAMPTGRINFRLRCPDCSTRYDADIHNSCGLAALDGVQAIKPALKRTMLGVNQRYAEALLTGEQPCSRCGATMCLAHPDDPRVRFPQRRTLALECRQCGFFHCVWLCGVAFLADPEVRRFGLRFMQEHPRWVMGSDQAIEYAGARALCCFLADVSSGRRLTMLVDPQRVRILKVFNE